MLVIKKTSCFSLPVSGRDHKHKHMKHERMKLVTMASAALMGCYMAETGNKVDNSPTNKENKCSNHMCIRDAVE